MDIFNLVHNRLLDKGFQRQEIAEFDILGVGFYQVNHINIIVKRIINTTDLSKVINEALSLRNLLIESDYNLWNTYLLVCLECEVDKDDVYLVERDTRAIRKYVIQRESDLNRIPFLDDIKQDVIEDPVKISEEQNEGNAYIKEILRVIIESQYEKLDAKKTDLIAKKILGMVNINED